MSLMIKLARRVTTQQFATNKSFSQMVVANTQSTSRLFHTSAVASKNEIQKQQQQAPAEFDEEEFLRQWEQYYQQYYPAFEYEDEYGPEDWKYLDSEEKDLLQNEKADKSQYNQYKKQAGLLSDEEAPFTVPDQRNLPELDQTNFTNSAAAPTTKFTEELIVPRDYQNARLDRFLKNYFKDNHKTHLSVTMIQKFIRKKQILVNGTKVTEANARVQKDNIVTIPHALVPQLYLKDDLSTKRSADTHLPLEKKQIKLTEKQISEVRSWVLFMNDEVIVINKPQGIAVQGGSKQKMYVDGMLHALKFDSQEDPKLVHRLDKDTSGILVIARNRAGSHRMQKWLMDKEIGLKKCYWCFVEGKPKPSSGRIKNFVEKVSTKAFGEKVYVQPEKTEGSKIAITEYKIIESIGESVSWLAMYPVTGRLHQLRVHCATTLNTPILGDEKYGNGLPDSLRPMFKDERLGTEEDSRADRKRKEVQLHLHARAMVLPYSDAKGERIVVTAPVPEHMLQTFEIFNFKQRKGNKLMFK